MVNIYYTIFKTANNEMLWKDLVRQMPFDIQQRISRYRKKENQYQLVLGRLLLQKAMQDMGFSDFQLAAIQYDKNKKPFWRENIDFSIAHSGNVVACAVSTKGSIGIDIERIQAIEIKNFQHILNSKDQQRLASSDNLYGSFFTIWTIKEALSKADGRGLGMDVKNIFINPNQAIYEDQVWYYQPLNLHPEYHCHFVTEQPIKAIVKEIR